MFLALSTGSSEITAWDARTGAVLANYKSATSAPLAHVPFTSCGPLSSALFLAMQANTPFIHVYSWSKVNLKTYQSQLNRSGPLYNEDADTRETEPPRLLARWTILRRRWSLRSIIRVARKCIFSWNSRFLSADFERQNGSHVWCASGQSNRLAILLGRFVHCLFRRRRLDSSLEARRVTLFFLNLANLK